MVVQHNLTAINANRYFGMNNTKLSKSLEKLSSGYAINRAGDNAAGLAVSEKMRAQISGINQGVKNAQDGISMVQTFEGALTETDSILQRMRTLATQSANGTYQNDVDREAIQLEYNQLNDELNQIADTDFNGVVVLNGGQMADGLKQVDGEFDYKNYVRDAMQLDKSFVSVVDDQTVNDSDNTKNMNAVWSKLNTNWDRTDASSANDGPESVDVEITYDATGGADGATFWKVSGATNGAIADNITATSTKNGGFKLSADGVNIGTVVLDQTKLTNGDKVVLTLNNPKGSVASATNIGASVISDSMKNGVKTTATKTEDINLKTELDAVTDADMTDTINAVYDILNGATFTEKITADTAAAAGDGSLSITLADDDKTELTEADGDVKSLEFYKDGQKYKVGYQFDATAGTLKVGLLNAAGDAIEKNLATITAEKVGTANSDTSGTRSWKINLDHNSYDKSTEPSVAVKEPVDNAVSKSNSNNASTATLTYKDNVTLQVGARTKDSVNFTFAYDSNGLGDLKADMDCSARGLGTDKLSLATQESANAAIDKIDNALNKVSMVRGTFGAVQNRLEHKIDNLNTTSENLTSAESRIRDTNMAEEMMNFTKNQILSQASQSMLAQANQLPQGVLSLLQ